MLLGIIVETECVNNYRNIYSLQWFSDNHDPKNDEGADTIKLSKRTLAVDR